MANDKKIEFPLTASITMALIMVGLFCFGTPDQQGRVLVKINPVFNGQPLVLNNLRYANANGDTLDVEEFKFYISAIQLNSTTRNAYKEPDSYHLIDAEDTSSLHFTFNLPAGTYQNINLNLGIDSATNVAGAMGGALDPTYGMYWAWNTGYINAKLTGHSAKCKTVHHAYEYHIGGYLPPYNAMRQVKLTTDNITILPNQTTVITINADAAEWFKNPATIDVAKTNSVVMPGKEAMNMADTYADMLGIVNVAAPQP